MYCDITPHKYVTLYITAKEVSKHLEYVRTKPTSLSNQVEMQCHPKKVEEVQTNQPSHIIFVVSYLLDMLHVVNFNH